MRKNPPPLEFKAVKARVVLMPTNQSLSDLDLAASNKGTISSSFRSFVNPSRMEAGVIDCNQSLWTGFLHSAASIT